MYILIIEETYRIRKACVLFSHYPSADIWYDVSQRVITNRGDKFSKDRLELKFDCVKLQMDSKS